MTINLSDYPKLDKKSLEAISLCVEILDRLVFADTPEDILEYMQEPMYRVLKHHGVSMSEQDL